MLRYAAAQPDGMGRDRCSNVRQDGEIRLLWQVVEAAAQVARSQGAEICAAMCPAPYPLSILTTATPGAQAFSMVRSAATPWNAAP